MKTFLNKETSITMNNQAGDRVSMSYAELSVTALNNPPEKGWTTSEMRDRLRVSSKLEDVEAGVTIDFEDAEFNKLKECVLAVKWNFMHKDIVAFEDYLVGLSK